MRVEMSRVLIINKKLVQLIQPIEAGQTNKSSSLHRDVSTILYLIAISSPSTLRHLAFIWLRDVQLSDPLTSSNIATSVTRAGSLHQTAFGRISAVKGGNMWSSKFDANLLDPWDSSGWLMAVSSHLSPPWSPNHDSHNHSICTPDLRWDNPGSNERCSLPHCEAPYSVAIHRSQHWHWG